jgi:uncharacterized protein (DUF885 family)
MQVASQFSNSARMIVDIGSYLKGWSQIKVNYLAMNCEV